MELKYKKASGFSNFNSNWVKMDPCLSSIIDTLSPFDPKAMIAFDK